MLYREWYVLLLQRGTLLRLLKSNNVDKLSLRREVKVKSSVWLPSAWNKRLGVTSVALQLFALLGTFAIAGQVLLQPQ